MTGKPKHASEDSNNKMRGRLKHPKRIILRMTSFCSCLLFILYIIKNGIDKTVDSSYSYLVFLNIS